MGNNPSRSAGGSTPHSPAAPPTHSHQSHAYPHSSNNAGPRREPRRRESIQTLTTAKATAAPPSASLESATAQQHSTRRPETAAAATPLLKPQDSTAPGRMGNEQSQPRPLSANATPPPERPSPVVRPVDGPQPNVETSPLDPTAPLPEQYRLPPSQFDRPPRLPLRIEEEVHTPGSPIISPADVSSPIDPTDVDGALPRRTSVLSSTTADDEDVEEDLSLTEGGPGRPTVPTNIEWRQGGEKVYVTGTFAGWNRKYRLQRDGPSKHKDALSATINLQPGTHHLKFIVDGDMRLSDHLPTAVDFTNILVNYIEVSPDDLPAHPPTEPVNIPGSQPASTPKPEYRVPPGVFPPQVLPPTPELQPAVREEPPAPAAEPSSPSNKATVIVLGPPKKYHSEVPRFLADLDAPEQSARFERANAAVNTAPAPPSLPMFMGKSILNGTTPMKDDSSVLIMPNHTVLNHLATSSIKNNVLATSVTTRYKRKFLTTIMYKPTTDYGD